MIGLEDDLVKLSPYDPQWEKLFTNEKHEILAVIPGAVICVEHFGSTVVPGLESKPIIDIALGVPDLSIANHWLPRLRGIGYRVRKKVIDEQSTFLSKGKPTAYHLHIIEAHSDTLKRWLYFRDQLLLDRKLCQQYMDLKHELASKFEYDRVAYGKGKDSFIDKVLSDYI